MLNNEEIKQLDSLKRQNYYDELKRIDSPNFVEERRVKGYATSGNWFYSSLLYKRGAYEITFRHWYHDDNTISRKFGMVVIPNSRVWDDMWDEFFIQLYGYGYKDLYVDDIKLINDRDVAEIENRMNGNTINFKHWTIKYWGSFNQYFQNDRKYSEDYNLSR